MKADVQYNDFTGSAAADISDFLGSKFGDDVGSFGKYFKIDSSRFEVVGISIYGTENFGISLICIDKKRSNDTKEHIVKMYVPISSKDKKDLLDILFKRLNIVLYSKFDNKYPGVGHSEEIMYSDFHENNEDATEEDEDEEL